MIWVSVALLVVQMIIAIVSYLTLYRHRVIYKLETAVLRMPKGMKDDIYSLNTENIDKKLKSGKYTVIQIVERDADKDLEIILGQIKK